jgi:integrase
MTNEAIINDFIQFCKANGMGYRRIDKYTYNLPKIAKWLNKSFNDVTKDDMIKLIAKLEEQPYTVWTKHDYKAIIKRFFKWLNGDVDYPDTVKWIRNGVKQKDKKLPTEMLPTEDIDALVNASTNIRDKALVRCLYESGCRISEFLGLKIKEITYDEYSPIIVVSGKTGSRRLRLIDKQGLLKAWLQSHPFKDNPDAYVWVSMSNRKTNKPIDYHNVVKILRKLASRSGVKGKVNPHNFRHSRATFLANKLTESQLEQMFGWVHGSGMASIYVHLSGRDLDEPLLKMSGLLDDEIRQNENMDNALKELVKVDPEVIDLLIERMKKYGLAIRK